MRTYGFMLGMFMPGMMSFFFVSAVGAFAGVGFADTLPGATIFGDLLAAGFFCMDMWSMLGIAGIAVDAFST